MSFLSFLTLIFLAFGCGSSPPVSSTSGIIYQLERNFTSKPENTIHLSAMSGASASLSGNGVSFDRNPTDITLPAKIGLTYDDYGEYQVQVKIIEADGSVAVNDSLKFEYFDVEVKKPIVSFSERATKDDKAFILVSNSRSADTNLIRLTGDVSTFNGEWQDLPRTSKLPVIFTPEDGTKTISVELQNIFGNISEKIDLSLEKKSVPVQDCQIELLDDHVTDGEIELYATFKDEYSEQNNRPYYFRTIGKDMIRPMRFKEFYGEGYFRIPLDPKKGIKNVEIQLGDFAENLCPKTSFEVTVDPDYVRSDQIRFKGNPYWSDSSNQKIILDPKRLPGRALEMHLLGQFLETEKKGKWLAFEEELSVTLEASRGIRTIYVKYRHANPLYVAKDQVGYDPDISQYITAGPYAAKIFIQPFVTMVKDGSQYSISIPSTYGLDTISVSGCSESYSQKSVNKDATTTLSCTSPTAKISLTMHFLDGSSVNRTLTPPS